MQVSVGPLSDEQRRGLERVRRAGGGAGVAAGAHGAAGRAGLHRRSRSREIFECGEDVVRKWLHRYARAGRGAGWRTAAAGQAAQGPPGPAHRGRPGEQPPPCTGQVQGGWTVGLLAAFLAARFRLVLSPGRRPAATCTRRAGAGRGPGLAPATHAPPGQRKDDPAAPLEAGA